MNMKAIFGILLMVLGIVLGVYVGLWLMFVGGIFDLIEFLQIWINTNSVPQLKIAGWGIVKICLSGITGALSAYALIIPGTTLLTSND